MEISFPDVDGRQFGATSLAPAGGVGDRHRREIGSPC
jgi:hypothetical protein